MTILYQSKARRTWSTRLAATGVAVAIGIGLAWVGTLGGNGKQGETEHAPVPPPGLSGTVAPPIPFENAQVTRSSGGMGRLHVRATAGAQLQSLVHKVECLRNRKHWRDNEAPDNSQLPEEAKEVFKTMRAATETMCADANERDELQLNDDIRKLASAGDVDAKVFLLREHLFVARATAHNYLGPNARGDTVAPSRPDVEQDLRELRTLADAGNRDAMRILGEVLIDGALTNRDEVSSFAYQYLANHPDAQTPEQLSQELTESVPSHLRPDVEKKVVQALGRR
jgi:hypothetical protein